METHVHNLIKPIIFCEAKMQVNTQIVILILGIIIVLYTFLTAQMQLGIVAAILCIIAILVAPRIEKLFNRQ